MKTNVNHPSPLLQISHAEVVQKKKVLLFAHPTESREILTQRIKEVAYLVGEPVDDVPTLFHEIARTAPHLLVIQLQAVTSSEEELRAQLAPFYPELPICVLQGDLSESSNSWKQTFQEALAQPIQPESPRAYAEDSRWVLHDEPLRSYWKGKLNRPKKTEGWEKVCAHQEARFVMQLQTARKNHQAAKKYYLCLLAQQAGLNQEIAYRIAHGSYKALSWGRELACKWLALLAHYLPDVELEYLPKAGSPGPKIDFVHHDTPMEGVYAGTLLILYRVKPTMVEAIKQVITARFNGQDDDNLLALTLSLYGMAKFLQEVGTAQIELMDAWLDPSIVDRAHDADIPRGEHRNAGIYRDFYDLGYIICSPEPLASILKGFHAGTTYVSQGRYLPSFAEIHRLSHEAGLLSKPSSDNP